jgi:hypothetical protein
VKAFRRRCLQLACVPSNSTWRGRDRKTGRRAAAKGYSSSPAEWPRTATPAQPPRSPARLGKRRVSHVGTLSNETCRQSRPAPRRVAPPLRHEGEVNESESGGARARATRGTCGGDHAARERRQTELHWPCPRPARPAGAAAGAEPWYSYERAQCLPLLQSCNGRREEFVRSFFRTPFDVTSDSLVKSAWPEADEDGRGAHLLHCTRQPPLQTLCLFASLTTTFSCACP